MALFDVFNLRKYFPFGIYLACILAGFLLSVPLNALSHKEFVK